MPNKPILQAFEISKMFKEPTLVEVFNHISLTVSPGESLAIMGPSGEGKSTLLHILGTLEHPTAGRLEIAGQSVDAHSAAKLRSRHIGFVFQSFHLIEDESALKNVLMPALIARVPIHKGSAAYQHGLELLEKVGLSQRAHFPTKLLSGGEKQRVAIARALCNDPDLLLADEPSGNLDHDTSAAIHELLVHCTRDLGKGLIVVTHDPDLAKLCERKAYLRNGTLIEDKPHG